MKTKRTLIAAATFLMLAGAASSQPYGMGPGMGGYGMGPGMMGGPGMGPGMMGGYGMGPGMMGGPGMGPGMMGGYGMGPGMMHGYGMGPGMMHGYGMGPGMMGGYGMGPGMMGGYGMGPGMMGGYGMGPGMMGRYGRGAWADLDLTADQQSKIADIQRETAKAMWQLMGKIHEEGHPMAGMFGPGPVDEEAARKAYDAMAEAHKAMFELRLQTRKRIESVLTDEQRERLRRQ